MSRLDEETAPWEESMSRLIEENKSMTEKLAGLELRLHALTGQLNELVERANPPETKALAQLPLLSAMMDRAMGEHGAVASRQAKFLAMHARVEMSLHSRNSAIPRWIRNSKSFNSLYRHVKRIRKMGKLLLLQSELNEAVTQSLGTLTDVAALMARSRAPLDATPAGLERGGTNKTPVDISKLAALLRLRFL